MNCASRPPSPTYGNVTKLDKIRYAFYVNRRDTPITIRNAWKWWREIREFQNTYHAFRTNVSRLANNPAQHLYRIETRPLGPYVYMLSFTAVNYLSDRGYISKQEENRGRKWVSFTIQDVMPESRVNKIIASTKGGWRTWER